MNSPVNPLLLLPVAIAVVMLVIWLLVRRRRAKDFVKRMNEQLAATAIHVPEHVRHPPPIAPAIPATLATPAVIGAVGPSGPVRPVDGDRIPERGQADLPTDGAVATSVIPTLTDDGGLTLTDMLEGIKLPYDLMPVPSVVEDPDRHIIFLTTHSNAGEVGKRFADELERLGFELESVDFDQAVAVRGDDVVSMKIVPNADQVEVGGSPRYGAAGSGDVALETWIGRSPVPPASRVRGVEP
ncbi:MAG: hypothetical protein OES24_14835 [Acidimicrobiia bacterium]|nr:hypothetical protein [Acidimicrobiia bacterium]